MYDETEPKLKLYLTHLVSLKPPFRLLVRGDRMANVITTSFELFLSTSELVGGVERWDVSCLIRCIR